jgi:hypothetical protein
MRYSEIRARPATTESHPFTADIAVSPAAFDEFERVMQIWQDVRLLARIDQPGRSLVHVACKSERARAALRHTWG